jgi:hypothetical protein
LHEQHAGEATCDLNSGNIIMEVSQGGCHEMCTAQHEAVHKKDMEPCCKKGAKAYKAAAKDDAKETVFSKMKDWGEYNRDYFEQRGYAASVTCADDQYTNVLQCTKADPDKPAPQCCGAIHEYLRKMRSMKAHYENNLSQKKVKQKSCPY